MSHHLSGPNLRSPMDDARLDLTDLFVFTVPGDRTVLIMNVHPIAPATGAAFHPDAVYRINVDVDGDERPDVAFSFVFSPPADGQQTASVYWATGAQALSPEPGGQEFITDAPVSFGAEPQVVEAGPYLFSAGLRSDPFFADLDGILKDFQWTGVDWGADKNVLGIALEIPSEELDADPIGVWARVSVRQDGRLTSVDRGAHPSLTAYFNADEAKTAYNEGEPATDWDTYHEAWTEVLRHTGGYDARTAEETLRTVLPDILLYDRGRTAAYPNGRTLTDDVTSARLAMISGGKIAGDHIGPHADLLRDFPYLGPPHLGPAAG
ncbi:hypothetical protein BGM19_05500 [Streptomyces agglomeratus]|uniref:DUF4331 domain-containing protein n=1 Tax=Streptomyces agglomeratus TaxID=285458 RepID=A0A1E5PFH8_9ACTN|nr:DUF4331 family protein [Streptomyces agglomeratus]OEJ28293.1 hypothetical protein AS594_31235 [Streptomyces agglomeratus]OEJ57510.1 hypothetical protein BGM19_05500 [Streptomyces agglomeratus]